MRVDESWGSNASESSDLGLGSTSGMITGTTLQGRSEGDWGGGKRGMRCGSNHSRTQSPSYARLATRGSGEIQNRKRL